MTVEEFNECVDLHADKLYRFVLRNVKDSEKARDVVQDTYEKLWLKVSDLPASNAKSYMFTAAYRTVLDLYRKEKNHSTFLEREKGEMKTDNRQYTDIKKVLEKAADLLPPVQKMVLMLRDYEGYSYAEIAAISKITEPQVKVYIFRARAFLKNHLGKIENVI